MSFIFKVYMFDYKPFPFFPVYITTLNFKPYLADSQVALKFKWIKIENKKFQAGLRRNLARSMHEI